VGDRVLRKLRRKWHDFKRLPVGRRFCTVHERQANAAGSFAVGIILTVLPGPAVVFFALAGALAAIESAWVARRLDRGEVAARRLIAKWSRRRGHSRASS
jgi:hypothetical protein